jgi:hypothetical protein
LIFQKRNVVSGNEVWCTCMKTFPLYQYVTRDKIKQMYFEMFLMQIFIAVLKFLNKYRNRNKFPTSRTPTHSLILRSLDLSNKSYQCQEKYTCFELSYLSLSCTSSKYLKNILVLLALYRIEKRTFINKSRPHTNTTHQIC